MDTFSVPGPQAQCEMILTKWSPAAPPPPWPFIIVITTHSEWKVLDCKTQFKQFHFSPLRKRLAHSHRNECSRTKKRGPDWWVKCDSMVNMLCALYLQDCEVTVCQLQALNWRNKDSLSDDGKRCAAGQRGHCHLSVVSLCFRTVAKWM